MEKESVLFVCTHNSARSQMAEGLLRHYYGDRYEAYSAGTQPGGVNPFAIEVMKEFGIDLSGHRSEHIDEYADEEMDYVVTVCDSAREECPYLPARKRNLHESFADPSAARGSDDTKRAAFRRARDEIRIWIDETFGIEKD